MATVAVTYTWVVEVDDPDNDSIADAVEEYVHSVSHAFDEPVQIERLED